MTEFVRPIQERIEDFLILDIEALCNHADYLKYHFPDSLSESEFHAADGSILEESTDSLIVREASCGGKQIVLQGRDGGHGNLRGEVAHLVLAKPEIALTFLEYDFQRPAPGVNPVSLEEVELAVGGDESVPFATLVPLGEEQTDITAGEGHIDCDVVATDTTAVAASLLWLVKEDSKLIGCVLLTFICVLRLAHLDHTEIVASDVAGSDEQDDLCTGKPAVGQYIVEMYLALDDTAYHLNHQRNLAPVVLLNAHGGVGTFVMLLGETGIELLLLQSVVPLLALLSDEGEVEQHLADAISNADEQPLEAEHHRVGHMGVYLSDKLCLDTPLGIVSVIDHQAYGLRLVTRPLLLGLSPELERDDGKNLAPVIRLIGDKPIEHVLLAVEQAA